MSLVMRYTDAQADEWERRAPEPFFVDELSGWTRAELHGARDHLLPNERLIRLEQGEASVHLLRFWDRPLYPGRPMQVASTRPIDLDGKRVELTHTSAFEGIAKEVDVLFLPGENWFARIVFDHCSEPQIAEVCAAIHFGTLTV
jgi:hypothetical protein